MPPASNRLSQTGIIALVLTLSLAGAWAVADDTTRPLIANTVMFAGGASLFALPIGIATAVFIDRACGWQRRLAAGATLMLIFLPAYLHVSGWQAGFGMQGWFCRWWFPKEPFALLDGWRGALFVQTMINLPWVTLITSIGLSTVAVEQEDLGRVDGTELQVLRHITLPQLRGAIVAAWLWCFVMAAGDITITDVYRVRTFAEELYMGFALGDDLESAPKRNLPGSLLIIGIASSALLACLQVNNNLRAIVGHRKRRATSHRSGIIQCLSAPVLVLLLAATLIPIGSLVFQAGLEVSAVGDLRVRSWSAVKALRMLAEFPSAFGQEFAWSFALGQLTSISMVALAFTAAALARKQLFVRVASWLMVLVGLAIPGPIMALAIGRLVNRPDSNLLFYLYDRTLFVPWLALSVKLFPYAYIVATWALSRISPRPLESTRLDTSSRLAVIRYGILPQIWRPIAWLWLLMLAMSVGDLSATILALPPGVTTVAVRIFNLVHYGVGDQLAALCLGTMSIFCGFALVVGFFLPYETDDQRR